MKNATMLYKAPGPHDIHGGHFDYTIVDADEEGAIEAAKAEGWHLTTDEAKAANEAAKAVTAPATEPVPPSPPQPKAAGKSTGATPAWQKAKE